MVLRRALLAGAVGATTLPWVRRGGATAARLRRRSLVLLYHRVRPGGPTVHDVVPAVSPSTLRAQLLALGEIADFVPLPALLGGPPAARPRVVVTFDDDDPSHVEHALPVLAELRVPAAFFVCGRSLHGLSGYWWDRLERAFASEGVETVARRLGVEASVAAIAAACEDPAVAERVGGARTMPSDRTAEDIRRLADAGMTIGFHTLDHPVLPSLGDAALQQALTLGRDAIEAVGRAPVAFIAYPYGRADQRVARMAAASGYRAGFATGGRAASPASDPFRIPRWEPGDLSTRRLVAEALLRLNAPDRHQSTPCTSA